MFCIYYVILFCLGSFCTYLSILVTIFQLLTKIHQNQFFLYFYGFKHLVLYNLVLCYSLDPVLVIWHVTLIIFWQIQVFFSKLKKVSFGKSKLCHIKLGKTAVLVIFMLIYAMVSCPQAQGTILCSYNENCIFINVIVFYFVFFSCFYWGRAKFNKLFHFLALCM